MEYAAIGLLLSVLGLIIKLISNMRNELKSSLQKESLQNENVSHCLHQIELLQVKIDSSIDKFQLADNGLLERINHSKGRLNSEIKALDAQVDELGRKLADFDTRLSVIENHN